MEGQETDTLKICPNTISLVYTTGTGRISGVKELIAAETDVNIGCECHGNGALGRKTVGFAHIKELTILGTEMNIQDKIGFAPVMVVIGTMFLIESISVRADVNTGPLGYKPLMEASPKEWVELVKIMISTGADINIRINKGRTPLMYASLIGDVELVETMISAGADVNMKDKNRNTSLMYALLNGNVAGGPGHVECI